MPVDSRSRLLSHAFPAACGLLFAGLWLAYRSYWLDDAFITFRYARNVAAGIGPFFNAGEAVEGYTTFLWMLLCSVPFAVFESSRALVAIKGFGLLLGWVVLWRVFTFPSPSGEPRRRYAVALLAASPVFIVNCGDGLETPLFALLLLELCRAATVKWNQRSGFLVGGLVAALVLTRPEALPLVLAIPAAVLLGLGTHRALWGWTRAVAVASLVPIAGHVGWRFATYGSLVPNTYYAKATGSLGERVTSGIADVGAFVVGKDALFPLELWLAIVPAVLGTALVLRGRPGAERAWHLVLWLGVSSRVAFDIWSGGAWMGFFRFLAPALPLLVVLADEGWRLGTSALSPSSVRAVAVRSGVVTTACALALVMGVGSGVLGHTARVKKSTAYRLGLERGHVALGEWLRARYAPDSWVAIGDCGAVPFYSGLATIDLWGLVDATVARLPGEYGHRPGTAAYALARRPDVIVLFTPVPIASRPADLEVRGVSSFDSEILAHPAFRRDYRFVREFIFRPQLGDVPGYYLAAYERAPGTGSVSALPPSG